MFTCVCTNACTCRSQSRTSGVFLYHTSSHYHQTGFLSELLACHFNQANWPWSTWAPPVSTLPMLGSEVYAAIITAGNSNSGAHACRARTLHQAASQHWKLFVLAMYFTLSMCEDVCVHAMKFRRRCQVSLSWGYR